jgi:ATP-dependent helicase/nuclease subunit A
MAAYAAALVAIYPGCTVEAAVLYTATPQLIGLPASVLDANKPDLPVPQ